MNKVGSTEEEIDLGPTKTQIRFNGVTKRRYKKQRQEREQAQGLSPVTSLSLTGKRGGYVEVGVQKRTRLEHNDPSPSKARRRSPIGGLMLK